MAEGPEENLGQYFKGGGGGLQGGGWVVWEPPTPPPSGAELKGALATARCKRLD